MAEGDNLDVVIVLVDGSYASTAVGPIEVFTSAGSMFNEMHGVDPEPRFRVIMASIDGGPIKSAHGLRIAPDGSIADVGPADLMMVSASGALPSMWMTRHAALLPWLVERYRQGTLLAGVSSGLAFFAAEARLLDGRRATTPWGVAEAFRSRYPEVNWRTDLLIKEGAGLFCGGGVNAATDLSLYLVERSCGRKIAVECSKALLLDMPRLNKSGYAILARQQSDRHVRQLEEHLSANFWRDVPIEELAEISGMSRRTLIRCFKEATESLPSAFPQMIRVAATRRLLEDGAPSIKQVGMSAGYEDVAFFRRIFNRYNGMTPACYRDQFRFRQT
ncbi:MAG: helix-turn-helix domain-containing protein [Alphaproteobacteria bacterium]